MSSSSPSPSTTLSLTVKTLDSRNHEVTDVPASETVGAFKARIVARVGIAAARQRLIYCGRVLQDDRALGSYGVDGKVVHLVQRAPNASQGEEVLDNPVQCS